MKKVLYILVLSLISGLAITSCTEEQVAPKTEDNGGGGADEPIKKT